MIHKLSIFLLLATTLSSCDKQNENPELKVEYILFGHFYGFCVGEECVEIFKLTKTQLFEDTSDQYPSRDEPYVGKFIELDASKFELVKSLIENMPDALLQEKDTIIGSPDYSDGGGVYFAIKNKDGIRFWLIDQFDHNIPESLRPFKAQINSSIGLINN